MMGMKNGKVTRERGYDPSEPEMNSSGVVPRRASYLVFASVWAGKRNVD